MVTITIHAGDFGECHAICSPSGWGGSGPWEMRVFTKKGRFWGEKIPFSELETVEVASEESVKSIRGTIGWGIAGGVLLGPAGLLAGLLLGGKEKEVTFVARFKDGRKMLATTDNETFTKLMAAVF